MNYIRMLGLGGFRFTCPDPALTDFLSVKRHKEPLSVASLEKLLAGLRWEISPRVSMEKYGSKWRLRFYFLDEKGGYSRRSLVIADPAAVKLSREYIARERRKREDEKRERRRRQYCEHRKALESETKRPYFPVWLNNCQPWCL